MKEPENDDRTVMVGASFDEIAAEASIAVKREIDRQIQEVMPSITQALNNGAAALEEVNAALVATQGRLSRYRFALFVLVGICAAESGFLAMLVIHR